MTTGIKKQAQVLLIKAAEDEAMLRWADAPDGPFGFHVQQAIEKLLKALLEQLSVSFFPLARPELPCGLAFSGKRDSSFGRCGFVADRDVRRNAPL